MLAVQMYRAWPGSVPHSQRARNRAPRDAEELVTMDATNDIRDRRLKLRRDEDAASDHEPSLRQLAAASWSVLAGGRGRRGVGHLQRARAGAIR